MSGTLLRVVSFVVPVVAGAMVLSAWGAGEATVPHAFSAGQVARASEVNENFASLRDQITANVAWRSRLDYNTAAADATVTTTWEKLRIIGTFTKERSDTDVVLTHQTRVFILADPTFAAQFQLRVDDLTDGPVNGGAIVRAESGSTHEENVILHAVFEDLAAGPHEVSLWSREIAGVTSLSENADLLDRTVYIEESPSR
jgi:hypothetical protein